MKRGRKGLRWVMPLIAVGFLSFMQTTFAQDDDYRYNDNSGNYDNSDEELISPEQDVNYNTFHDELLPYGTWRDYPGYGNVWVCNVAGFSPYNTGGHWAYTRFGWTWVSDYNWGWAPFHYGRWGYDASFGYFWVPGYTWGPAWVSWRNGGDYYGWAPLSPGLSVGINMGAGIGALSWTFLPHRYMGDRNCYNYYAPRQQNETIIRNTTIIYNTNIYNNNRFITGPDRRQVERYSGQSVERQNIYVTNNRNDNGQDRNGSIAMFQPGVNKGVINNRINNIQNGQPAGRAPQDNVRQQPLGTSPMQNGIQQPNGINGAGTDNNPVNPFQQRREDRMEHRQEINNDPNGIFNNGQRNQDMRSMRDRMQQQNGSQHMQQMEQMRQQNDLPQDAQRQQQLNDRHEQMMQQQQMQQQQRQDQMQQQRQQMMQERRQINQPPMNQQRQPMQQQFQQRSQNINRPAFQNGGGGRRGRF